MIYWLKYFFSNRATDSSTGARLTTRQYLFALAAFLSVGLLYLFCPWTHLHPQVWSDLAYALGLKSDLSAEHGLWCYCVSSLIRLAPNHLPLLLHLLGALSGAFCAGVMYLLLCMLQPLVFRSYSRSVVRVRLLLDLMTLALVWLLALSEGYWNICRFFTVQTSLLLLVMIVVLMQVLFLATARIRCLLVCYFVTGLLAGGSALGILLLIAVQIVFAVVRRRSCRHVFASWGQQGGYADDEGRPDGRTERFMPLLNPLIAERLKTPCAVMFLLGFVLSALADICFAMRMPGVAAGDVLMNSLQVYVDDLLSYADALDIIKVSVLIFLPLAANLWFCRQATDTEKFLPRHLSFLYLITAVVAYTQISGFSGLWFWMWKGSPLMPSSPLYLALTSFLAILVVSVSLVVFLVDATCRDFLSLVGNSGSDGDLLVKEASAVLGHSVALGSRRLMHVKGVIFLGLVLVLCALSLPARRQLPQRIVMDAIIDYLDEVVREARDCDWLVTDGAFDDALRLAFYKGGSPAALVSSAEGRRLGEEAGSRIGWTTDLPWCNFAGGWDFSGLVARRNVDGAEARESSRRVKELAERFVAFDRNGTLRQVPDRFLKRASDVIKWQLARTLVMRLQTTDGRSSAGEVQDLESLVRALDGGNASLQAVLTKYRRDGAQASVVLTPEEGLAVAVNRGDFNLARRYADIVLSAEPGHPLALYAKGMIFLEDDRCAQAAEVLKQVAAEWPDEPAVLNNLAVALSRAGRSQEAQAWMRKAVALPRADSVVRTNAKEILGR